MQQPLNIELYVDRLQCTIILQCIFTSTASQFFVTLQAFAPVVRESRGIDEQQAQRQDGLDYKVLAIATTGTCEREETEDTPLTLASSKGLRSVRFLLHVAHSLCLCTGYCTYCNLTARILQATCSLAGVAAS